MNTADLAQALLWLAIGGCAGGNSRVVDGVGASGHVLYRSFAWVRG